MTFSDEKIIYVVFNYLYKFYYNPESSKEIAKIYRVCKMFKNSIDENNKSLKSLYFIPETNQELKITVNEWCDDRAEALRKHGHISLWLTGKITDMSKLFKNKVNFNDCIKDWDTSAVTSMYRMFHSAKSFNQCLNNWDTSSLIDMSMMFCGATSFNQPLNNWNTSSVTEMYLMFNSAKQFNQPLNNLDTSSVTHMPFMFKNSNMTVLPSWYKI
jgi:surface protein